MTRKRELEQLLAQKEHDNDLYVKRIASLEAEVNRLHEQEQAVLLAIQEANRAAVRINEEATKSANDIRAEANARREELLREAQQKIAAAADEANIISEKADEYAVSRRNEADTYYNERISLADSLFEKKQLEGDTYFKNIVAEADEYFKKRQDEADSYSENIRTDANIFVERTILGAQKEVSKRKDVIAELNIALYNASKAAAEQSEYFISLMNGLAKELTESQIQICAEVEKCTCNCAECDGDCSINENVSLPNDIDDTQADVADDICEKEDVIISSAIDTIAEQPLEDAALPIDSESDSIEFECEDSLPADYETPADLMRSIYSLEGRDIPSDTMSDISPEGGLLFRDELSEATPFNRSIPVDEDLDSILEDVLSNGKE